MACQRTENANASAVSMSEMTPAPKVMIVPKRLVKKASSGGTGFHVSSTAKLALTRSTKSKFLSGTEFTVG